MMNLSERQRPLHAAQQTSEMPEKATPYSNMREKRRGFHQ
jgi:hypothetical protein